jgi:NADH-quinone oxidoreductase subunit J
MTVEQILFYCFASGGVVSALLMITRRNPIISALWLITNFFCLAGLYLTLHAQFIAIIQILVYAGAIMVLFVFVIMLLNLGDEERLRERFSWRKVAAGGIGGGLAMELTYIVMIRSDSSSINPVQATNVGTVEAIGRQIFTRFLFPFEVTSFLLTAAIVGAIVLAKKKLE